MTNTKENIIETTRLQWFAVHVYAGFENHVKKALEDKIRKESMENMFGEIWVPTEVVEEIKSGVRKSQIRRCFPGYILIQMIFSDATAHLVRTTSKITDFLGHTKKPTPLSSTEVERVHAMVYGTQKIRSKIEFVEGDKVRVVDGPFSNFNGSIEELRPDKQKLRVLVSIFGRATPIELDYSQVETIA